MFGLCVGVAVFTFVYEAIKSLRHALVILQNKRKAKHSHTESETAKKDSAFASLTPSSEKTEKLKFHCIQSLLHMIQLAMGYMVMLIVMSYNLWLVLTIVVTTALCFYFHEYVLSRKSLIMPLEIPGSNL
ncbi:putative low affinity copper uptake protein 2 like protein [Argiope bruennichi]|uniref:Copper transport protein n=2 Tax=Argiope bruennichi TaxID=94029 RepID=A0A8T0EW11_ARGBR|nr:putative low affinity copper uptake protein 2 like protein [Argiope bruennichi]